MRNFRFKDKLKEIYDHILVAEDGGEAPEENGENIEQVSAPEENGEDTEQVSPREDVAATPESVPVKTARTTKNRRDIQKARKRKRKARK